MHSVHDALRQLIHSVYVYNRFWHYTTDDSAQKYAVVEKAHSLLPDARETANNQKIFTEPSTEFITVDSFDLEGMSQLLSTLSWAQPPDSPF